MRIYLAAPSIYQTHMRTTRAVLQEEGFIVTSRWLDVEELGRMLPDYAKMDIEDIDHSDVFILYPLRPGDTNPSAGHMWECGYAYSAGKILILMGEPTSLFLTLPRFHRCHSIGEAMRYMETL